MGLGCSGGERGDGAWLAGHRKEELVYVGITDDGEHVTSSQAQFAQRFGWRNDPAQVVLVSD